MHHLPFIPHSETFLTRGEKYYGIVESILTYLQYKYAITKITTSGKKHSQKEPTTNIKKNQKTMQNS